MGSYYQRLLGMMESCFNVPLIMRFHHLSECLSYETRKNHIGHILEIKALINGSVRKSYAATPAYVAISLCMADCAVGSSPLAPRSRIFMAKTVSEMTFLS